MDEVGPYVELDIDKDGFVVGVYVNYERPCFIEGRPTIGTTAMGRDFALRLAKQIQETLRYF